MDLLYAFYTFALALAVAFSSPWWLCAMLFSGKYRKGFSQRAGRVPARLFTAQPRGTVWLHAVSVGELLAAQPLIARLAHALPTTHPELDVVISTTTRTGQQLAREKFGAHRVFYFPFDFPWILGRYIRALRPRLMVLLETEFWPNHLHAMQQHGIPVAVVNARISDRSYPRYRRLRWLWRRFLRPVTLALAQSPMDAQRLREIGLPALRIHAPGNLKYDRPTESRESADIPLVATLRQNLPLDAPVWVCGSTGPGEDAAVLAAHRAALEYIPDLVTILAPRHPERFAAVAAMLPSASTRRSQWMQHPAPIAPGSVFLLDSIGELAAVYSLATVAFVGGSLFAPGGGQNPLEPASHAVPMLAGPRTQNFRGITEALRDSGALITTSGTSLARDLVYLLQHSAQAQARGQRGRAQVEANRGATDRTLQHLLRLLENRADDSTGRAPLPYPDAAGVQA